MNLSRHFTLEEACISQTAARLGLDNRPERTVVDTMVQVADHMEMVRYKLGYPILVSSWYRSPEVDAAIRPGSPRKYSQHQVGEAVDFICPSFGTPIECIKRIISEHQWIPYDQLIYEHTWIHISFAINPSRTPRGQVISLLANGGYTNGLTDPQGKLI